MLSLHQLSEQIDALSDQRLSLGDFENWFVSESWGSYAVSGDAVSNAIAAIHHVLYNYESEERDENMAIREIASAIRPFEPGYSVYRLVLGTPGKPPQRAFESGPFNQPVSMVLEVAR